MAQHAEAGCARRQGTAQDDGRIAEYLARLLTDFREGRSPAQAPPTGIERYDRRALAGEFAEVFRRAMAWARG